MMQQASSTSNSDRNKNIISISLIAVWIIIGTVLFGFFVHGLNYVYCLYDDQNRVMWKSFYMQDDIDTVFLGSSHVYCGVDVFKADEVMGGKCFDVATGGQCLMVTYYDLLAADRRYGIENCFLDLPFFVSTGSKGDFSYIESIKTTWRTTDHMHPGPTRAQAIWDMSGTKHLFEAYFPFIRFRGYLFDWDFIKEQLEVKRSDQYKNYIFYRNYTDPNVGHSELTLDRKGFWYTDRILYEAAAYPTVEPDELRMSADAEKYLRKIIEYTQKNDINLTLMIIPVNDISLLAEEKYDTYLDSLRPVAEEYSLPVYDFNLIKREYLDLGFEDFRDGDHLNTSGAEKFTSVLFDVLQSDDQKECFYSSYAEKLRQENPRLYGGYWAGNDEKTGCRELVLGASDNPDMEFEVMLVPDSSDSDDPETSVEKYTQLQSFSPNRHFEIPADEHGKVVVRWRMKNAPDDIETMEFSY